MTKNNSNTVKNKNVDENDKNHVSILEFSQSIQKIMVVQKKIFRFCDKTNYTEKSSRSRLLTR